ncbi:MAG: hypothetical protein NVSMB22_09400 [Chloroflexota bacterium]
MKVLYAFLLAAAGGLALSVYNNTPHYGPTVVCAPITILGTNYSIGADCRVISALELTAAVVFFLLAVIFLLLSRPRRRRDL